MCLFVCSVFVYLCFVVCFGFAWFVLFVLVCVLCWFGLICSDLGFVFLYVCGFGLLLVLSVCFCVASFAMFGLVCLGCLFGVCFVLLL